MNISVPPPFCNCDELYKDKLCTDFNYREWLIMASVLSPAIVGMMGALGFHIHKKLKAPKTQKRMDFIPENNSV